MGGMSDESDGGKSPGGKVSNWALSTVLGVAVGTAFGVAIDNIAMGVTLGFTCGVFFQLFWRRGAGKTED